MRPILAFCLATGVVSAAAFPNELQIFGRAPISCDDKTIKTVTSIFKSYSATVSKICSSLLRRGPPPTANVTLTVSSTTTTTATSGTVTATATDGISVVTSSTTVLSSSISTVTTSSTTSVPGPTGITTTIVTTFTTSTTTRTVETPGTTIYDPYLDGSRNFKRADTLGQAYPGCPKALSSVVLNIATKACDCFIPVSTSTRTIQTTATRMSTVFVPSTAFTTAPSSTSTAYITFTSFVTGGTTTTVVQTSSGAILTVTRTETQTEIGTSTTFVRAAATPTARVDFRKVTESGAPGCSYSGASVLREQGVSGLRECAEQCARIPYCAFFLSYQSTSRGSICQTADEPFDPQLLLCGNADIRSDVGYNRAQGDISRIEAIGSNRPGVWLARVMNTAV